MRRFHYVGSDGSQNVSQQYAIDEQIGKRWVVVSSDSNIACHHDRAQPSDDLLGVSTSSFKVGKAAVTSD